MKPGYVIKYTIFAAETDWNCNAM